jgi:hypothetical protein
MTDYDHDRYIKAAQGKFPGDNDVVIHNNADVEACDDVLGAWVNARVFVHDDELEPVRCLND